MALGEILWFDAARGFGYIRPDMGPSDVFVHISALREPFLPSGTKVEFELIQDGEGRLLAHNVLPQRPPSRPRRRSGQTRKDKK